MILSRCSSCNTYRKPTALTEDLGLSDDHPPAGTEATRYRAGGRETRHDTERTSPVTRRRVVLTRSYHHYILWRAVMWITVFGAVCWVFLHGWPWLLTGGVVWVLLYAASRGRHNREHSPEFREQACGFCRTHHDQAFRRLKAAKAHRDLVEEYAELQQRERRGEL